MIRKRKKPLSNSRKKMIIEKAVSDSKMEQTKIEKQKGFSTEKLNKPMTI